MLASSVLPRRKCVSVTVYSFALRNHTHSTTAVAELDSPGECAQSTHFLVRLCDGPGPAKPWEEPGGLEGVSAYSRSRGLRSAACAHCDPEESSDFHAGTEVHEQFCTFVQHLGDILLQPTSFRNKIRFLALIMALLQHTPHNTPIMMYLCM